VKKKKTARGSKKKFQKKERFILGNCSAQKKRGKVELKRWGESSPRGVVPAHLGGNKKPEKRGGLQKGQPGFFPGDWGHAGGKSSGR